MGKDVSGPWLLHLLCPLLDSTTDIHMDTTGTHSIAESKGTALEV